MGRWLVRLGINRRTDLDPDGASNRIPGRITARYPGHMIHLDVKKAGRIPAGGGWRVHGRGSDAAKAAARTRPKGVKAGYVYLHSAIDGYSRLAYTEHLPNETAATTIGFFHRARAFFAAHGIHRIVRVITDNGPNYRSAVFYRTVTAVASRHQRTRPYTPRHNGKVERYNADPGRGVPLRPHLDQRSATSRRPPHLEHPLQRPSQPHRRRRPAPSLTHPNPRHQPHEPEQLAISWIA